ncbi:ROK family protein [Georgenia sunbinii]|uniref:ROK family protein n=1 Tax=Georgenia sunbinii TaxID=3117728 RepID=UPI003D9C5081
MSERSLEIAIGDGPELVLDSVAAALMSMLEDVGRPLSDVLGVGVGLPGPVEHDLGRPISPPIMPGWDGFDVPRHLQRTIPAPILVDNDVNIMALGEHGARWPDVANLIFVKVATGIGAGIISDGKLRRGAQGAAGDLGHIAVPRGRQTPCRCGNLGCLEALASGHAVVETLRNQGYDIERTAQIVDFVRAGDTTAMQTVRQSGRDIGDVVAGCVNLLNPSVIVIGGIVSEVGEHLLAGIREVVYSRSLPLATQHLRIVASQTAGRAGILGASQMVSQQVLSAVAIDELLTTH